MIYNFSNNFETTGRSEIGQYELGSSTGLPGLGIITILATFHCRGTCGSRTAVLKR